MTSSSPLRPRRVLLLAGVLLCLLAPWALGTRYASEQACEAARGQLPSLLGAEVSIGRCALDPFSGGVVLHRLEVRAEGAPAEMPPLFAVDEAELSGAWLRPAVRALELGRLRLIRPRVHLDLRRPRPRPGNAPACLIEPLKRVEVQSLSVQDAAVELLLPAGRAVRLRGLQLSAEQRRGAAEFELTARGAEVVPGAEHEALPLSRLLLRGSFSPRDERVEFRRAEVGMDAALLSFTGAVETLCAPELALEAQVYLPVTAAAKLAVLPSTLGGHAWARVSLSGPAADPRAVVDVTATDVRLGGLQPGDFQLHARVADGRVELDPVTVPLGEGRVRARGVLALDEGLPFHGSVEVEHAGFGRLLEQSGLPGSWVDFQAAARLQLEGRVRPFELGGDGELEADRFVLAARPWNGPAGTGRDILAFPRGEASFGFRVTPERTDFSRIAIRTAQGQVRGEASIHHGARRGLEVRGAASELDLTSLAHLAGIAWSGRGATEFEVQGPWGGIRAEAQLHLRDFSYWRFALGNVDGRLTWGNHVLGLHEVRGQKGQSPYTAEGELDYRPRGGLEARGRLALDRGRAEDVAEMAAPLSETLASLLVGSLSGGASLHLEVAGPGDRLGGTVRLGLRDAAYDGRRLGTGELRFTLFDGEGYRLEPSMLVGPVGTLRAEGQSLYDGPLDYRFRLEEGALEEVLGEPDGKVRGRLTVSGKWEGDSTTPVMTAWVTSPGLEVAGRALGAVHLETRMAGRELQVWGRPFDGARLSLKMRAKSPYPYELQASAALDSLGTLFPEAAAQGLSGAVSGTLKAHGSFKQDRSTEGALVVDRFQLQRGDFSGENDGPLRFGISAGRMNVEAFNFRGPNTQLVLAGSAGAEGMDLKLGGVFDMRLAESFTSAFERAGGKVELAASATGPWDAPQLAGTAEVKDVRFTLKDGALALRNAGGRLEFSGARVLVQELSGTLNNGRVRLQGEAGLEGGGLGALEASLAFEQVTYRPREWLPLTASGEVLLSGRPGALLLQGALEVEKLRYEQSLDLQSVLGDLRRGGVGVGGRGVQEEAPAEWLKLDVSVRAGRDVWVDNNLARARLVGELRLTGTNVHPGLLGTIETAEGGEAFYRGNRFALKQGVLEFRERDRVEPVFDLNAETQAREFLVRLHAFGRAASPQVVLQAEPELSEADILSLLTLGVVSRDRTGVGGEAGAGLAAEAFLSASGLGDRVQRFLPRNQVFRDLSFHLSTTYNDASGLVEPTAQLESRFLTEQLKLGMTRPMSGRGTRAQAEYRFDARTSAQVQWDNQVSADFNNVGNLGLELKLRWEVD